jgi:hypothetical protein
MKIKIDEKFKAIDGESFAYQQEYDPQDLQRLEIQGLLKRVNAKNPMILKDICIDAIMTPVQSDTEKDKYAKWDLYKKFLNSKNKETIDLDPAEVVLIQKCVEITYSQLIVGQVRDFLNK